MSSQGLDASRSDASPPAPIDPGAVRQSLKKLGRYLELYRDRAAQGTLPPFADDALRQHDLACVGIGPEPLAVHVTADELATAQALYRELWRDGGRDEPWVEQWLLHLVAFNRDPAAVPFWLETLDRRRPEDTYLVARRTYALAALAALAARGTDEAWVALRATVRHPEPAVRATAVGYLVRAYGLAGQSVPAAAIDVLGRVGHDDPALEPRAAARALLEAERVPLPADHPDGVYTFKLVALAEPGAARTLQLRSVQTLAHLHLAVQRAIGGAADASYAFYVPGDHRGGRFVLGASDGAGRPPSEACLGELGLSPGHRFRYRHDRGDEQGLVLEVTAVRDGVPPGGGYPRVLGLSAPDDGPTAAGPQGQGLLVPHRARLALLVRTHINGTKFYDAPAARGRLAVGDVVQLRRERDNAYDDRAIEVGTASGAKLGYVPRARNRVLAALLDAGESLLAVLQTVEGREDWPYLVVDISTAMP